MGKTLDELPAEGASLKSIDENAVKLFIRKALNANRISLEAELDDTQLILSNLNLITEDGKLKNAALLLFGRHPRRFLSQPILLLAALAVVTTTF
jgi:ATP-dependent DNA helicase RecG